MFLGAVGPCRVEPAVLLSCCLLPAAYYLLLWTGIGLGLGLGLGFSLSVSRVEERRWWLAALSCSCLCWGRRVVFVLCVCPRQVLSIHRCIGCERWVNAKSCSFFCLDFGPCLLS